MNAENKINIHYSSLVVLKTELLRKQAEVEIAKAKQENFKPLSKTKCKNKTLNEKINTKELEENKKSNKTEDIESMKTLHKSKLMLQAKSRLYEKLSKTHINLNPNFLVDFISKPDDSDCFEEEYQKVENNHTNNYDSDSEWIEYTDYFGRTRKCLQEDLHKMQEKDEFIKRKIHDKSYDKMKEQLFVKNNLAKKEPDIEMRKKWEEQTAKLFNKVNIHYEDVLFNEARTHGVGYYAFSQNEDERVKQQQNLLKLRKETEQKQKENQEIVNMKDKLQQNRLRVAWLRQRIRAGLPVNEIEEEITVSNSTKCLQLENSIQQNNVINNNKENPSEEVNEVSNCKQKNANTTCEQNNKIIISEQNNDSISYQQSNKQEIAKNKLVDIENKIEAYGQLLGKRNHWYIMSQEEWVHKKRKERTEEFGPIYENFEIGKSLKFVNSHSIYNPYNSSDSDEASNAPMPLFDDNININIPNKIPVPVIDKSIMESIPVSQNKSNILKHSTINEQVITQTLRGTKIDTNITCQIEAGLKYLREQFENKHP